MGYDPERFTCPVNQELLCKICFWVLEDPLQAPDCEQAFCKACIHEWLNRHQTCPVDRRSLTPHQLKQASRILKNLLSELTIKCEYAAVGCEGVVTLDQLQSHLSQCEHNPKRPVNCESGCGLVVPFDELPQHNHVCLNYLMQNQNLKQAQLQAQIDDQRQQLNEHKREIQAFNDMIRAMRVINLPQALPVLASNRPQANHCDSEVHQWLAGLQSARVTRWGGMISTPNAVLQAVIRRALADSGCPPAILNKLMENVHERKWPPGLSTLETRQLNRRLYRKYVFKRIPGKQAVVIMACENEHMGESMTLEPGLVMIFAHGIE